MVTAKVTYRPSETRSTCYLTTEQIKQYKLSHNKQIKLNIGSLKVILKKEIIDQGGNSSELSFSEDLKYGIYIPQNTQLQVKKISTDYLEIGPLVGFFISSKKAMSLSQGKSDSVYEHISATCQYLSGLCCFFSDGDIDWDNKLIKAFLWKSSQWVSRILPLPRVIYDRCFGKNSRSISMNLRKKLGSGYHVINAIPKLGKWETINVLKKNPLLINHLPETYLYRYSTDIEMAIKKLKSVYLKPNLLYKGKGIFRVSIGPGKSYKVEQRNKDNNDVMYFPALHKMDELLNKYLKIGGGYLIQQTIPMAKFRGYPFDFRLLYQKDWQGLWQPSGIAIRMGAPGSIITSPRSGGAVEQISTVLKEVFKEDWGLKNGLYEEVINIGREAAKTIEREFGDCVELGLDMTIDEDRNIWIIEINGKPLKVSLKWLNDAKITARCYNRPMEYATYLSGFTSVNTELEAW